MKCPKCGENMVITTPSQGLGPNYCGGGCDYVEDMEKRDISIDKNISPPAGPYGRGSRPRDLGKWLTIANNMKAGDSVLLSCKEAKCFWQAVYKRTDRKITTRLEKDGMTRCWILD